MSDGVLKAEKDFTKEADKIILEAESLAEVRSMNGHTAELQLTQDRKMCRRLSTRF